MILDNEMMFADSLAYNGSPATLDLGAVSPGPGKPITVFFTTEATLTGATSIEFLDDADGDADEALLTVEAVPAAGETIQIELPSDTQRYVTVALGGTASAGTFSCGVVLEGVQTNR